MPSNYRSKRRSQRRRVQGDHVSVPLAFVSKEGTDRVVTIASMQETFDAKRPFRFAYLTGKLSSYGVEPVLFQWEAYGPSMTFDNTWVSPVRLAVPNGTSFRYKLPVTKIGWFPSDTPTSTVLLRLKPICVDQKDAGVIGYANVTVFLQPPELDSSCPKFMIKDPNLHDEGPSHTSSYSNLSTTT